MDVAIVWKGMKIEIVNPPNTQKQEGLEWFWPLQVGVGHCLRFVLPNRSEIDWNPGVTQRPKASKDAQRTLKESPKDAQRRPGGTRISPKANQDWKFEPSPKQVKKRTQGF